MKYHVRIGDDELEIDLLERDGSLFLLHEGRETPVDLTAVRNAASYSLLVGDHSLPLVASGPNDDLTLQIASETWNVSVMDERERIAEEAAGGAGGGGGVVQSVMPGIVREVRVEEGQEVAAGDALVILEAMKMQNEIRAEADGVVSVVHVQAGTAVAKGDDLVTLSAPE